MITVFSCPKPFINKHIATIQRNAIKSWTLLHPEVQVLLFGNDSGVAEMALELGVLHIPEVAKNIRGTPLINDIFKRAQDMAAHPRMVYVNGDIILMDDIVPAIKTITEQQFIMFGRRIDIDITDRLSFGPEWRVQLRSRARSEGKLHSYSGIDYFVFPTGLWRDMPPFAVGRPSWDNWLLHEAWVRHHALIDATEVVTCVHQNHDYSHVAGGFHEVLVGVEEGVNSRLAANGARMFSIRDADHVLTGKGLRRAPVSPYSILTYSFRHYYRTKSLRPVFYVGHMMVILIRRFRRFLFLRLNKQARKAR